MADWLDDKWPIEVLADLLKLIHATPNLDWLLLSKRVENFWSRVGGLDGVFKWWADNRTHEAPEFMNWLAAWLDNHPPANIWLGTSVENQEYADKRIPELLKIPAKVRFLSCEPLLEEVNIFDAGGTLDKADRAGLLEDVPFTRANPFHLRWIIVGGESGQGRRPFDVEWARSMREQCRSAGVPFFMKQLDKVQPIPPDLMIREFPV